MIRIVSYSCTFDCEDEGQGYCIRHRLDITPHSVRKYFIVRLRNAFQSVDITVRAAPEGEPHPELEAKFGKKYIGA